MFRKILLAAVLSAAVGMSLAACGGEATPTGTTGAAGSGAASGTATPAGSAGGSSTQVRIVAKDNLFEPMSYTVEVNSFQIVAVNEGKEVHEVEVKGLLPETKLAPGQSKTVDVTGVQPGTYTIYCEIHEDQGMEGELIVK
jgi:plastocyanin